MKSFVLNLLLLSLIGLTIARPQEATEVAPSTTAAAVATTAASTTELAVPNESNSIITNTQKLIEVLVANLREAARQAGEAFAQFTAGVEEQVRLFREQVINNLNQFRERVANVIQDITDRFTNSGTAIRECVEGQRKAADALFNETLQKTMECADEKISEIRDSMTELTDLSSGAMEYADVTMSEMRNCTLQSEGNLLNAGSCLGSVAVQAELKGAVFLAQSGMAIGRINLALATLPASLEVCAGSKMVEAGSDTIRIVMDIGRCSASSIFSTLLGYSV